MDLESHKAFQTLKNLKLMSDIYMYKNLRECNAIFKILEPRLKAKTSKDHFKELRLSELSDLIWFNELINACMYVLIGWIKVNKANNDCLIL